MEVIAKIKLGYRFLAHPVHELMTGTISDDFVEKFPQR